MPTKGCCIEMRSAKLRMGEVKEEDMDENGMIKDQGRWDFKKSLREVERKVKKMQIDVKFDLGQEIEQFIDNSFNQSPIKRVELSASQKQRKGQTPQRTPYDCNFFVLPKINEG